MKFKFALLCSIGLAATQAMACYTVYDPSNRVVYNGLDSPVDMRLPLHEALDRIYPGGHMVFDNSTDCPRVQPRPVAAALPSRPSPLLTDQRTAEAMNAPHVLLASGAVLVEPNTNVMGAGPAVPVLAHGNNVVITEMHTAATSRR